jgi:hypothetical protein
MTVTPPTPESQSEHRERAGLITVKGVVILTLGGVATAVAFVDPPLGIAIGVGLAVVTMLERVVKG